MHHSPESSLASWVPAGPTDIPIAGTGSMATRSAAPMQQWLLVVLLTAVLIHLVLAVTVPILDPTEGRYSEISREMATTENWVTPWIWFNGEHRPFFGKPPLFFWTAATSIKLFGANELAVRLPAMLAAASLLAIMWFTLAGRFGREAAAAAIMMTATSALFFFLFASVIVDMHLMLFVAGALFAHLAFSEEQDPRRQKRWSLLIFALLAGGFMTKGPVALVLFGLPVLAWTVLRARWELIAKHAWGLGVPLFLLLVVPWFVLAEMRNPGFLHYFFIHENLLRYISPDYGDLYGTGHQFPRGSALLMFAAATLPWSPFALWHLLKGRTQGIRRVFADDISFFLFLGFAANILFWCFARQLLATYMLPMIPLFTAWIVHGVARDAPPPRSTILLVALSLTLWSGLAFAAVPFAARDSTRAILQESAEISRQLLLPDEVTFIPHLPQSAMYYAGARVRRTVQGSSAQQTIRSLLSDNERRLVIMHDRDATGLPEDVRHRLLSLAAADGWRLFVTRVAGDPPATRVRLASERALGS